MTDDLVNYHSKLNHGTVIFKIKKKEVQRVSINFLRKAR